MRSVGDGIGSSASALRSVPREGRAYYERRCAPTPERFPVVGWSLRDPAGFAFGGNIRVHLQRPKLLRHSFYIFGRRARHQSLRNSAAHARIAASSRLEAAGGCLNPTKTSPRWVHRPSYSGGFPSVRATISRVNGVVLSHLRKAFASSGCFRRRVASDASASKARSAARRTERTSSRAARKSSSLLTLGLPAMIWMLKSFRISVDEKVACPHIPGASVHIRRSHDGRFKIEYHRRCPAKRRPRRG
jgi:hypothetical protein